MDCKPSADMTRLFIEQMNIESSSMKLNHTNFNNPHGLADSDNTSTASDMAIMSMHLLNISVLNQVVNTISHKTEYLDNEGVNLSIEWTNTNKML